MVNLNYDALTYASIGGLILGLATTINYVIRGKVTGMSGIVFGIVSWNKCTLFIYSSRNPLKALHCWRHVFNFSNLFLKFWLQRI